MKDKVTALFEEALRTKAAACEDETLMAGVAQTANLLGKTVKQGGTVYICGNGGSACDAMHFAEELVARYKRERKGVKAMHFMDPGTLTCWSNDYEFDSVFKRQVETFCTEKDLLITFSTSGNSGNVLAALEAAKQVSCPSIVLTGRDGGKAAPLAEVALVVPAEGTERIQEVHITIVHVLCELLETELCPDLLTA